MSTTEGATTKPACDLSDAVDDKFKTVMRVSQVLDRAGQMRRSSEFWGRAMLARSYAGALEIAREYVEVIIVEAKVA